MLWNPFRSPKIAGICVVKNEQDIIEPFVRHNLKFLDSLAILDNGSVDDTKRLLQELAREFTNVSVADEDCFKHAQSDRMTRMLHQACSTSDYVIALDGDEFIGAAGRRELRQALESIPPGGYGLVPWKTFVLAPVDLPISASDPPRSLRWRRQTESPPHWKAVIGCDRHLHDDLVVAIGNHEILSASGRQIDSVYLENVCLMHFPVRSRDQFIAKTVVGWMAHLARDPKHRETGYSWHRRDAFDQIASGMAIDDNRLCELSFLYAQTVRPIEWASDVVAEDARFDYCRRYSSGKALGAIELIARSWEQSLLQKAPQEMAFAQASA
jgi:Glycosyl transferase family 2